MGNFNLDQFIPILIIALTGITSIMGFNNKDLTDKLIFNVGAVLKGGQWYRLVTSAFLHGGWMHLIFNMMTLYFFSDIIVGVFGVWRYLIIYFASVVCGGLLSLFIHRREYYYMALGASGGVVGILFAAIALAPNIGIGILFIPGRIPGWIFGLIYLGFSIYGMRNSIGNIGHDAHLGGAVVGLASAIIFLPGILQVNGLYIAIMTIPLVFLGYLLWKEK